MSARSSSHLVLSLLSLFLFSACSQLAAGSARQGNTAAVESLRPGDTWAGATLATGASEATSVWAICQPAFQGENPPACHVPAIPLAIGPSAAALSEPITLAEWNQVVWTLVLDGKPVALDAFGTFDFAVPRKAAEGRDALFIYQAWDVVLANPTPGPHTLQGTITRQNLPGQAAVSPPETLAWAIDLVVQ